MDSVMPSCQLKMTGRTPKGISGALGAVRTCTILRVDYSWRGGVKKRWHALCCTTPPYTQSVGSRCLHRSPRLRIRSPPCPTFIVATAQFPLANGTPPDGIVCGDIAPAVAKSAQGQTSGGSGGRQQAGLLKGLAGIQPELVVKVTHAHSQSADEVPSFQTARASVEIRSPIMPHSERLKVEPSASACGKEAGHPVLFLPNSL